MLISIPLGFMFKNINSAKLRHWLSISLGLTLQYILFRECKIY